MYSMYFLKRETSAHVGAYLIGAQRQVFRTGTVPWFKATVHSKAVGPVGPVGLEIWHLAMEAQHQYAEHGAAQLKSGDSGRYLEDMPW